MPELTKKIRIIVDSREMNGGVPKGLDLMENIDITVETMEVGDYVVSDRCGIERKGGKDLRMSLFDTKTFFGQVADLARAYSKPLLILEDCDFWRLNMDPNTARGMIFAVTVDLGVPIIYTKDKMDTVAHIARLAIREQTDRSSNFSSHGKRSHMSDNEKRLYVVTSVCDVGPVIARNLLAEFKTVENVMKASYDELLGVPEIGPVTAKNIRDCVSGEYHG